MSGGKVVFAKESGIDSGMHPWCKRLTRVRTVGAAAHFFQRLRLALSSEQFRWNGPTDLAREEVLAAGQ